MGLGATILMILFFPLNFFLMLGQSSELNSYAEATDNKGLVQGAETQKDPADIKINPQATDDPQYQAVKLASATNLVIPNAHAFAIIDADTGKLLAGSHADDQRQIASLTKMMTAGLTMDNIKDLNTPVTINGDEVYIDGTKIGCPRSGYCISQRLKLGEQITAGSLLQAMLMNSANDAAMALGEYMGGGSPDAFAVMMNQRAQQMGLQNTHFCTPSGLDLDDDAAAAGCYSSAYDIGRIAAYDLRYPLLWKIFKMPNDSSITSVDGKTTHIILNSDLVLNEIPGIIGGKTGFTPLAGYSLLMAVSDPTGKHRIIAVLLGDNNRWSDIKTAVDWAFKSYTWN